MTDTPERRRMHPDVEHLLLAIQSRDDAITALRGDMQAMPEQIGRAVQEAHMRTVSDAAFWAAIMEALGRQARDHAGGFVLDGLRGAARKLGWLLLIVGGVYLVGGWAALGTFWKSITGSVLSE